MFSFEFGYTDNIAFSEDEAVKDSYGLVSFLLPVERKTKKGAYNFGYAAAYRWYQETEALDYLSHSLFFSRRSNPDLSSSFDIVTRLDRNIDQGNVASLDEPDLFLGQRSERTSGLLNLRYRRSLSVRWEWTALADAAAYKFSEIDGFDDGTDRPLPEDRTSLSGGLEVDRKVSRRSTVGLGYNWSRFDLDVSGVETVQTLYLTFGRHVRERTSMRASLGVFRRATPDLTDDSSPRGEDTGEGAYAEVFLVRDFRRIFLSLEGRHAPSPGGDLPGTATVSHIRFSIGNSGARIGSWALFARYARRDPVEVAVPTLDSLALGGDVYAAINGSLGARLRVNNITQFASESQSDVSVFDAVLGLVYYPRGRPRD